MTLLSESPSANDFSASDLPPADFDFSALGEAQTVSDDTPEPVSTDRVSPAKDCPTCGEPVYKEPGSRGRTPKYHPECKPTSTSRVRSAFDTKPKAADVKAGKEADEIISFVKPKLAQSCVGLMLVDQYTGMVWMMSVPGICDNLHGILLAHPDFRRQMLLAKGGGSWIGLIIALLIPTAATCARFGLIPQSRIAEIVKNLPIMMHKVATRMREGNIAMDEMIQRVTEEGLKNQGGAENAASNGNNPKSPFGPGTP